MKNLKKIEINKCQGYIELIFKKNWEYVSSTRKFILNFMNITLDDVNLADRIALAASELIENAIKFSLSSNDHVKFTLLYNDAINELIIEIENTTSNDNLEILKNEFNRFKNKNPEESYQEKLEEVPKRSDNKSMLGLARIRYEADGVLYMKNKKQLVTIGVKFQV